MHSDTAHVLCRNRDCGAEYDQRVGQDAWDEPNRHKLPDRCGVCGAKTNVIVTETRGPAPTRI